MHYTSSVRPTNVKIIFSDPNYYLLQRDNVWAQNTSNETSVIIIIIIIIIKRYILALHLLNEICKHCKHYHYATHFSLCTSFNTIIGFLPERYHIIRNEVRYCIIYLLAFLAANEDTMDVCLGPAATCGRAFLVRSPMCSRWGATVSGASIGCSCFRPTTCRRRRSLSAPCRF